jgi:hypothetical protein
MSLLGMASCCCPTKYEDAYAYHVLNSWSLQQGRSELLPRYVCPGTFTAYKRASAPEKKAPKVDSRSQSLFYTRSSASR